MDYVIVVVATLLVGGFSIPIGLLLGLEPLAVYLTATLTSIGVVVVALTVGEQIRERLSGRSGSDAQQRIIDGRAGQLFDRWGVVGLAIIGGVILGPTVTITAALVLKVDRIRFGIWWSVITMAGFALFTLFWDLVLS